jgi:NAD-dependent DNA ligase
VTLWWKYVNQHDDDALSTLREYNKEDVLLLRILKEKLEEYSDIMRQKDVSEKPMIQEIRNGKPILVNETEYSEPPLTGQHFVITGTLAAFSRQTAEARIKALGGTAGSSVSRKTSYLVVGANPGSKLAEAQTLGTRQLTEEEFLRLLEEKG